MKLIIFDTQGDLNINSRDIDALNDAIGFIHPDSYAYGSMTDRQYRHQLRLANGADAVKLKLNAAIKYGTITSNNLKEWVYDFIDGNREDILFDWKSLELKDRVMILEKILSLFKG